MGKKEQIEILDRRINFYLSGLMAQGVALITLLSLALSIKGEQVSFFKLIHNEYFLGCIFVFEFFTLYHIVRKVFKYLKKIESLYNVTGKEDFLK
ncbi:hypothetical protein C672_3499 [[Clostridium] bifermentans ATCC 638]|uniref:Uncharacterized protein n=1 Tax=Paraclostridium bifermentans ATCC 638 = DSM 14991 TaxID=1233171 RepID=T4VFV6_PARBF|nr:hypothetical protein [Paraclostridium bifermentans]EQK40010.1 hypothetical protein C672_3499 [[Clostridium] bifermentans ATCC 638] [Paraclostridium bifermentans ATCC 638 = DSM 14991]RIZ57499.1 hypothetical protein CHH45_16020 [Paraclostridium bifermentans]UAG19967.1 hypothetical protein KXZ80_16955 [Paraclostridium bifermentans]